MGKARLVVFLNKLRPVDAVTAVLIFTWAYLKCHGINHVTDYVIIAILGWYYGGMNKRTPNGEPRS